MKNSNLNSGTPIFKIRIWRKLGVLTVWNNPLSHAKRLHSKSQTHIEHLSAEMNTPFALDFAKPFLNFIDDTMI